MGKTAAVSKACNRADQKFEKKLQFYSKVRETVAALGAQKAIAKKKKLRSRQRKLKVYDLSALSGFLPDLNKGIKSPHTTDFKLNCESRQSLVVKEGNQLKSVLNHPAFKSDPLRAIHQHLLNTKPLAEENQVKKQKKSGKKVKKKKSKASIGPQFLETMTSFSNEYCSPYFYNDELLKCISIF